MSKKDIAPLPVWTGEQIPGTRLWRRFRGDRETTPEYREDPTGKESVYAAFDQAKAQGYGTVEVLGRTYLFLSGDWYSNYLYSPAIAKENAKSC